MSRFKSSLLDCLSKEGRALPSLRLAIRNALGCRRMDDSWLLRPFPSLWAWRRMQQLQISFVLVAHLGDTASKLLQYAREIVGAQLVNAQPLAFSDCNNAGAKWVRRTTSSSLRSVKTMSSA